jgi:predicted phosphodiesterase
MAAVAARRFFRIQYASDLHLEFYDKATFPLLVKPAARYLALAGDIGHHGHPVFHSFLDYTSKNWDHVFYVAGNHEYYNKKERQKWNQVPPVPFQERQKELCRAVASHKNITFLHHDAPSYHIAEENVTILGSTLWSYIPEDMYFEAVLGMNDYNYIPWLDHEGNQRPIKPRDVVTMHEKERANLEQHIDYARSMKHNVVMLTHHMPSYGCISPRYADNKLNCCFASHCESMMGNPVRAWIYGHTHNASTGVINNTFVAVNARGYPNQHVEGFSPTAVVEFDTNPESQDGVEIYPELAAAAAGIRLPSNSITKH